MRPLYSRENEDYQVQTRTGFLGLSVPFGFECSGLPLYGSSLRIWHLRFDLAGSPVELPLPPLTVSVRLAIQLARGSMLGDNNRKYVGQK
jgi:hypothetical protein